MSDQQSEEIIVILRRALDSSEVLTQDERHKASFRLPPAEEDTLVQGTTRNASRAELIQACLDKGAWDLTDGELQIIIKGISSNTESPLQRVNVFKSQQGQEVQDLMDQVYASHRLNDPGELDAIMQCYKEQNYRREAARTTRQLHRYRLVERRYQELLQDGIQKAQPIADYALKRRAFEQIMRETKGQVDFPRPPTNDSLSQKIQDFAIKAQLKPRLDIGIWGFAILRLDYSDDEAWAIFKSNVETVAQKVMRSNNVPEPTCKMLQFVYLEDEEALSGEVDQTKLVGYWKKNGWNENVHMQINHQFFFSATGKLSPHENPNIPSLYLHDTYVEETPTDPSAFPGFILTDIFQFFAGGIAGLETSRRYVKSVWDILN
ncbi:hypothetical protein AUEXF2481DRAFT_215939 [Aureobasidium subglaciale EXF-2481]|uniref:Uncharacterized protein n=1 Tax=Aureobasidium subglaciale (strain EXF-2481) TaxID=1043005 RepID=A0A074YGX8_AURSE|nr:uncharacterized protein AUEXF2481DRAFT_215939 [Aureobasidium subglaciale EXF-2481]KEQ95324.1 hypothetical protein AUEXF2481DRAFT_215939 [Aureobasidium subglaciale EXF-2481]